MHQAYNCAGGKMKNPGRDQPDFDRRISPAQRQHKWSRQCPRQPSHQQPQEQPHPRVMHAFGPHHKNGLSGIEQPDSSPDQCNPEPWYRRWCAGRTHTANRTTSNHGRRKMQPINIPVQELVWFNKTAGVILPACQKSKFSCLAGSF